MSYDSVILAEAALVHFWKLDEAGGSGTIADSKGALSGTVHTGVTLGSTSLSGDGDTAASFDGSTGYISFASLWGTDAHWTYECLFRRVAQTAGGATGYLANSMFENGQGDLFNGNFSLAFSGLTGASGTTAAYQDNTLAGSNQTKLGTRTQVDGTTYHCAFTFDGSNLAIYINGVLDRSQATAGNTPGVSGGAGDRAVIGCCQGGNAATTRDCFWHGGLSKVAYYSAALSAGAIAAHYAALVPPAPAIAGGGSSFRYTRQNYGVRSY